MNQKFTFLLVVILYIFTSNVKSQVFTIANQYELESYIDHLSQFPPEHMSAYNVPDRALPATNYYVHSWDKGENLSSGDMSGFEFLVYGSLLNAFISPFPLPFIMHRAMFEFKNISSIDVVIMQDTQTDDVYVVMTYYNLEKLTFEINVYEFDGVALSQHPDFPMQLDPLAGVSPFGWIRNDVMDNNLAIIWEYDGGLYLMGFEINNGFGFTNTIQIDPFFKGSYMEFLQPDIAFTNQNAELILHFVATDDSKQELFVGEIYYNNLWSSTGIYDPEIRYENRSLGFYNLPRIDGRDYDQDILFPQEPGFAVVVEEEIGGLEYILGFIHHVNGGVTYNSEFYLNSGTGGLLDISDQINRKPVVSFSEYDDEAVYFGWYHQNQILYPNELSAVHNNAYIGQKFDLGGSPIWGPSYYVIPKYIDDTPLVPAMAFSGNNRSGDGGLYMAFRLEEYPANLGKIGYKQIFYTATEFRPVDITGIEDNHDLILVPNPYNDYFQLKTDKSTAEIYSINVTDIVGRQVFFKNGTIDEINGFLQKYSPDWQPGMYIIQLDPDKGNNRQVFRINKL